MQSLKSVLPLAGLFMAGQALARKALHDTAAALRPTRPVLAVAGNHPDAPLEGVGGWSAQATSATPTAEAVQALGKKHRYTNSH